MAVNQSLHQIFLHHLGGYIQVRGDSGVAPVIKVMQEKSLAWFLCQTLQNRANLVQGFNRQKDFLRRRMLPEMFRGNGQFGQIHLLDFLPSGSTDE